MKKIINYLRHPIPFFRKRWLIVFISTAWIFLLFFFFTPFGIQTHKYKEFVIAYFTVAMFVSSFIVAYLFPRIFKKHYAPENWNRGKFLLFSFTITTLMAIFAIAENYFVSKFIVNEGYSFPFGRFLSVYFIAILFSILPTLLVYLIEEKIWFREKINNDPEEKHLEDLIEEKNIITLSGNTKDELMLSPEDFLYAEVVGNYVNIYYLNKNIVSNKSLRATLAQIIESFSSYPEIVRSHRAFIINTSHITHITGNSRGCQITINHIKNPIPASRSYTKVIKEMTNL